MREQEPGRFQNFDEIDEDFVVRQVAKAFAIVAHETELFWQRELAMPVESSGFSPTSEQSDQEAFLVISPSSELVDDRLNGGATAPEEGVADPTRRRVDLASCGEANVGTLALSVELVDDRLDGGVPSSEQSDLLSPSTEPSKEKQPTIRLDGTVDRSPSFSRTSKGVPRIVFPLSVDGEIHTVYSTKERAEAIHELALQRGEWVHVSGVKHQWTDGNATPTERFYAWNVTRKNQ